MHFFPRTIFLRRIWAALGIRSTQGLNGFRLLIGTETYPEQNWFGTSPSFVTVGPTPVQRISTYRAANGSPRHPPGLNGFLRRRKRMISFARCSCFCVKLPCFLLVLRSRWDYLLAFFSVGKIRLWRKKKGDVFWLGPGDWRGWSSVVCFNSLFFESCHWKHRMEICPARTKLLFHVFFVFAQVCLLYVCYAPKKKSNFAIFAQKRKKVVCCLCSLKSSPIMLNEVRQQWM